MNEHSYRPDIRVRLIGEQPFFGPGTALLLHCIRECGSVSAACDRMKLSYSKGRNMLRKLEHELKYPLVQIAKGGVGGGGHAWLTPEGERFLEKFNSYSDKVIDYANNQFGIMREILSLDIRQ
jgi:molybdate transport repressor ModE-like protein